MPMSRSRGRFLQWLGEIGFTVKGSISEDERSKERYGANLVALAVDATTTCRFGGRLYLVAGDIKLLPLVMELRTRV